MLRLAILSGRGRISTFTGALVALTMAATLVVAGGMPLEAALRTHPPVERYAGTAAVVTGQQIVGAENDVPLGERARVDSTLAARLAAVPGVRAAIGDVSVPARLGGRDAAAHGWSSAALTPYVLSAGRAPVRAGEAVTGYRAKLGARLRLASTGAGRTVTVVGIARPRNPVRQRAAIFLTDAEATRLAGHPGKVDAVGVLAGPGFDASRLRAVSGRAVVLTGDARGVGEYPELQEARTTLIAVTASFGGMALFIAIFVVAGTLGLSIQQREREIALLRAVAATPGQIRRMIAWEAVIVGLLGSAAGIWPGTILGRELAEALVRHGIAPSNLAVTVDWLPIAAAVAGGVTAALLAVLSAGRRAARVPPTLRAVRRRSRATTARPRTHDRRTDRARRSGAAVRRRKHHQRPGHGRGDVGDDGALPRRGGRLPGTDRGPHRRRSARAPAGAALAGRRLPGVREPAHRHPALLVGQHAADAHRRP